MKQGLIGVIVPVYKVEKYIAECIESILAQTYTNFRLILVDDGTPDNAGKICDEYEKKDSRITVIHQENAGVTRARARGVEEAKDCEFIMFVDSDDKLMSITLSEFYKHMNDSTDIIMGTCYYIDFDNIFRYSSYQDLGTINYKHFIKRNICLDGGEPWGKLYRSKLFDRHTFDIPRDITCGEDVIMNIRLAFNSCRDLIPIRNPLYFHRIHDESVFANFKHTPEYEETFRVHLLNSIPQDHLPEFMSAYIKSRILLWRQSGGNGFNKPKWSETTFHKRLISEVEKYHYKLSYFENLLLLHTKQPLRALIFIFRRVFYLFKRIFTYMLNNLSL